jgi:HEAT repeat protein
MVKPLSYVLFLYALTIAGTGILLRVTGCSRSPYTNPYFTSSISQDLKDKAHLIISEGLSHPDARVRTNAIEVIAYTRELRYVPQVRYLLRDEIIPVRFAAATALGDLRVTFAEQDLQQIASEPQENGNVTMAASYALVCLGHSEYLDPLLSGITSQDMTVRANAVMLIGKLGKRELVDHLYSVLGDKSSDDKVLMQAIESIAMLGDDRIYDKLWAKLISAYVDDRIICIRAMGELGTEQAKNALLTMLSDNILEVRLMAAQQLGRLGNPAGESVVLKVLRSNITKVPDNQLEKPEMTQIKVLASLAIGTIKSPSLTRYLPDMLNDRSDFVKLAAAKSALLL